MKIAIVGGGPGGLFFARLLKHRHPDAIVRVFDQSAADATFGFGVTLGGSSLGRLAEADPEIVARLSDAMVFDHVQNIQLDQHKELIDYALPGGSISRLRLLQILQEGCREVGVELAFEQRIANTRELSGYDLIVGADGVNSIIRQERAAEFGTATRTLTNHFAWYGVRRAMTPNSLVFRHALGGRFVAHYYAYSADMSTFVAECDDATWHMAGLDRMSDPQRKAVFEQVFAPEMAGDDLVENRSIWRQFPAITNQRWHHENVVLIGDALRSAHFSIGSGTRLAMEDAQALCEAFTHGKDVSGALDHFVALRQPSRDRFGDAAQRSFEWYERLESIMDQPGDEFAYDFLTRTGRITPERFESYAPAFAARYRTRNSTNEASH